MNMSTDKDRCVIFVSRKKKQKKIDYLPYASISVTLERTIRTIPLLKSQLVLVTCQREIAYIKTILMCSVSSVNGFGIEYKELLPNIGRIVDTAFQNLQMISYWLDQIKMQCVSKIK